MKFQINALIVVSHAEDATIYRVKAVEGNNVGDDVIADEYWDRVDDLEWFTYEEIPVEGASDADLLEAAQKAHAIMTATDLDEYFDMHRIDEALKALKDAITGAGAVPREVPS
jgi:hypothetical protein